MVPVALSQVRVREKLPPFPLDEVQDPERVLVLANAGEAAAKTSAAINKTDNVLLFIENLPF
jgi:hypothetical protein